MWFGCYGCGGGEEYMSESKSSSSGIGFTGLLTIVFIVLKLIGKITWSWWWVLSPLWISTALVIVIFLVVLIVTLVIGIIK